MTRNDLIAKWELRFADNDTFEIDEADFREFKDDIAATFAEADYRQLRELVLPQVVDKDQWYTDNVGIWEARRSFTASVSPTNGPNWRAVVSFTGQGTQVINAASIIDATDAGRKMLTAASASVQRALVSNPEIEAGQYGQHPGWSNTDKKGGLYEWLILQVLALRAAQPQAIKAPAAPTNGQVDDTADTFSFLPNPLFPSFAQYKVNGLPGITGAVVLDATNSYVSGNRVYVKVVGAVAKGGLAVYVAGSGNLPDGAVLTNADPFTGAVVVVNPPASAALTAALAISVASLTLGSSVAFTITPAGGTAPYSYAVVATDTATGQQVTLGAAQAGSWTPTATGSYAIEAAVTDSSSPAKMAQAATRYLNVVAATNRIPVADAGQDVVMQLPTSSVALMGTASDPDTGDTLTYAWRQITGPANATGLPATTLNVLVSNLVAGTYQFGFRSTDNHGAQSSEDFVVVTVNAAAPVSDTAELFGLGDSKYANPGPAGTSLLLKMGLDATKFPAGNIHIIARSGESADQQLVRLKNEVLPNLAGNVGQHLVVVGVGVNDLRIGDSTADSPGALHTGQYRTKHQIAHDILEIGRLCRLAGVKVILVTFGADRRQYLTNPTEDSRMVNLMIDTNNITLANAVKFGFAGVLDLSSDSFVGTPSAPINYAGSYYLNDLIHWSQQGAEYVAAKLKPIVEQVAATALGSFADPGEYQAPAGSSTSTGVGPDANTPYALTGFVFAEGVNVLVQANSIKGVGTLPYDPANPAKYWGSITSQNKAGATTNQVIAEEEHVISEKNLESICGWNNNNTQSDTSDIVFGWHFRSQTAAQQDPSLPNFGIRPFGSGGGALVQGGNNGFIAYTEGDKLRTRLEKTRVVWLQNGIERYVLKVSTPPVGYFVDMAVQPGGVVDDIRVGADNWIPRPGVPAFVAVPVNKLPRTAMVLQHDVNVALNGNNATKNAGGAGYDAGFIGTLGFGATSENELGSVDFVLRHATAGYVVGVHGGSDAGQSYQEITAGFAIQVNNQPGDNEVGWRYFLAGGAVSSFVDFVDGDRLRFYFSPTQVFVTINGGAPVVAATYHLPVGAIVDAAMNAMGAQVEDIYISAANAVSV